MAAAAAQAANVIEAMQQEKLQQRRPPMVEARAANQAPDGMDLTDTEQDMQGTINEGQALVGQARLPVADPIVEDASSDDEDLWTGMGEYHKYHQERSF